MSEIADRHRRLAAAFADKVAAVPDDRWSSPSPCEGWTALDVVRHTCATPGMFLGYVGRSAPEGPPVDDDPVGAYAAARDAVQVCLDDPEVATQGFEGFFGPTTFEEAIDRFLCFDLLVHGWDLARATGQDEHLDPADVERARAAADAFGPALRSEGVCGAEVEVGPDASAQDQLLAYLGRRP